MWHAEVSFHIFVFISFHLFLFLFSLTYFPSLIVPLPPLLSYTFFMQLLCPPHFNKDPLQVRLISFPFFLHLSFSSHFFIFSSSLSLSFSLSFSLSILMYPSSHLILSLSFSIVSSLSYHIFSIMSHLIIIAFR